MIMHTFMHLDSNPESGYEATPDPHQDLPLLSFENAKEGGADSVIPPEKYIRSLATVIDEYVAECLRSQNISPDDIGLDSVAAIQEKVSREKLPLFIKSFWDPKLGLMSTDSHMIEQTVYGAIEEMLLASNAVRQIVAESNQDILGAVVHTEEGQQVELTGPELQKSVIRVLFARYRVHEIMNIDIRSQLATLLKSFPSGGRPRYRSA